MSPQDTSVDVSEYDILMNNPPMSTPNPEPVPKIDQRFVDRIVARAQNSMMSLGDPKESNIKPYDLANYSDPQTFENVAILLVSAHDAKYDLVSLMRAAMEETRAAALAEHEGLIEEYRAALQALYDSAHPHPVQHPAMFPAWTKAGTILSQARLTTSATTKDSKTQP